MIDTMAKKIKWVERPTEVKKRPEEKISLLWLREGELANVVETMIVGRGWSRKTITKVLGQAIIIKVHMPGMVGYSEVLWNGAIRSLSHQFLRPVGD